MPLTDAEQRRLDELRLRELQAKEAATSTPALVSEPDDVPGQEVATDPLAVTTEDKATSETLGLGTPQRGDFFHADRVTPEDAKRFENLGAIDRLRLFAAMAAPYAKRELVGDTRGGGAFAARAAGPAIGQNIGRASRIPGADRVLGGIGGAVGELAGEIIGEEDLSGAKILAAVVPGAMRGTSLVGASGKEVTREAVANAAGNVAAKNVESIAEGRGLASPLEDAEAALGGAAGTGASKVLDKGGAAIRELSEEIKNGPSRALQAEFRKKGYVFIPSKSGNGAAGDVADFLGGASPNTSALANVASLRNQEVTNDLARSYLGVPKDMPFDEPHIAQLITKAEAPYRAVDAISPQAKLDLELYKQSNGDAKKAWKAYDREPTPDRLKIAKDYEDMAELALDDITKEAEMAGKTDLVKKLEAARIELAKIHLVDRAANFGDYTVSPKTFYNAKIHGVKLDPDGDLIARMYAANPGIMRDKSSITTVGSGKIPLLSAGVRSLVLSNPAQNFLAGRKPIKTEGEDFIAKAIRLGILSETRDDEDELPPEQ